MSNPYLDPEELETIRAFEQKGYHIFPLADDRLIGRIREQLFTAAMEHLGPESLSGMIDDFFSDLSQSVAPEALNDLRMHLFHSLATYNDLLPKIYRSARKYLDWIVGNELAIQRKANLSIQMVNDASSLLPVHSDVWSGNSPYEVVLWLPLVHCYKTKSMYILPREQSQQVYANFKPYAQMSAERLFGEIEPNLVWLDVPPGHGVIFSHSLLHGNRVNREGETRWSMNLRFKSLLSPYGTKELGESFLPLVIRPATRFGMNYRAPEC